MMRWHKLFWYGTAFGPAAILLLFILYLEACT